MHISGTEPSSVILIAKQINQPKTENVHAPCVPIHQYIYMYIYYITNGVL